MNNHMKKYRKNDYVYVYFEYDVLFEREKNPHTIKSRPQAVFLELEKEKLIKCRVIITDQLDDEEKRKCQESVRNNLGDQICVYEIVNIGENRGLCKLFEKKNKKIISNRDILIYEVNKNYKCKPIYWKKAIRYFDKLTVDELPWIIERREIDDEEMIKEMAETFSYDKLGCWFGLKYDFYHKENEEIVLNSSKREPWFVGLFPRKYPIDYSVAWLDLTRSYMDYVISFSHEFRKKECKVYLRKNSQSKDKILEYIENGIYFKAKLMLNRIFKGGNWVEEFTIDEKSIEPIVIFSDDKKESKVISIEMLYDETKKPIENIKYPLLRYLKNWEDASKVEWNKRRLEQFQKEVEEIQLKIQSYYDQRNVLIYKLKYYYSSLRDDPEIKKIYDQYWEVNNEINKQKEQLEEKEKELQEKTEQNLNTLKEKEKELQEKIEQKLNILKKQEEKNENIINEKLEELQNQKNKVAKLSKKMEAKAKEYGDLEEVIKSHNKYVNENKKELVKLTEVKNAIKSYDDKLAFIRKMQNYGLGFIGEEKMANDNNLTIWNGNTMEELIDMVKDRVKKSGFYYDNRIVDRFVEAMFTNQLIILFGPTGTGKTSLPQRVSEAVGGCCEIISVQSNWSDNQDLLGFYNFIEKRFVPTTFLDALVSAGENPDTMYFVVLDEMNLAQVEYYFAKILSAMETDNKTIELYSMRDCENARKRILFKLKQMFKKYPDIKTDIEDFEKISQDGTVDKKDLYKKRYEILDKIEATLASEDDYDSNKLDNYFSLKEEWDNLNRYPAQLQLPANVQFVGTINMDASTKNISPKVIDRSFMIGIDFQEPEKTDNSQGESEKYKVTMDKFNQLEVAYDQKEEHSRSNVIKTVNIVAGKVNTRALSHRGEERARSILNRFVLSSTVDQDKQEIDALLGEIDDASESKTIKEDIAKNLTADIVISRLLPSIDNRQVINDDTFKSIKAEIDKLSVDKNRIKNELERMYDRERREFNYWRQEKVKSEDKKKQGKK